MNKEVEVDFIWVNNEVAEIKCPNCGVNIIINISLKRVTKCECGKKYLLHHRKWVTEEEKCEKH